MNKHISFDEMKNICKQFDIGDLITVLMPLQGTVNINIPINTTTGKYVCKFFYGEKNRINEIVNVIKTLKQKEIPVLLPIKEKRGNYFTVWKDKAVQITPYINGLPFTYDTKQMTSSGKTLKRFHNALMGYDELRNPIASIYPSREILKEGLDKLNNLQDKFSKDDILIINSLYERITMEWERVSVGLPRTVIHGDWNERNQLFTPDGEVCCIFDFEFIQRRERLFDYAYTLWILLPRPNLRFLAEPFINGYGDLTEQEESILPISIARVSFFFICTAALSANPIVEAKRQIEEQIPFIQYILTKESNFLKKSHIQSFSF